MPPSPPNQSGFSTGLTWGRWGESLWRHSLGVGVAVCGERAETEVKGVSRTLPLYSPVWAALPSLRSWWCPAQLSPEADTKWKSVCRAGGNTARFLKSDTVFLECTESMWYSAYDIMLTGCYFPHPMAAYSALWISLCWLLALVYVTDTCWTQQSFIRLCLEE